MAATGAGGGAWWLRLQVALAFAGGGAWLLGAMLEIDFVAGAGCGLLVAALVLRLGRARAETEEGGR